MDEGWGHIDYISGGGNSAESQHGVGFYSAVMKFLTSARVASVWQSCQFCFFKPIFPGWHIDDCTDFCRIWQDVIGKNPPQSTYIPESKENLTRWYPRLSAKYVTTIWDSTNLNPNYFRYLGLIYATQWKFIKNIKFWEFKRCTLKSEMAIVFSC